MPVKYSSSAIVGETWQCSEVLRRRRRGHYGEGEVWAWSHDKSKEGSTANSVAASLGTQAQHTLRRTRRRSPEILITHTELYKPKKEHIAHVPHFFSLLST